MSKTITIRIDDALRKAIDERARVAGLSASEVIRGALHEALEERPLGERIGHLRGALRLPDRRASWREDLRSRNWRP